MKRQLRLDFQAVAAAFALWFGATVYADDYTAEWAPPIGSAMPAIEAQDQSGAVRTFANLAGENGMLIFLNRSADW